MPANRHALYLIAYDIADPKRLGKIHRYLKKLGLPLQYSVFTVSMRRKSLLKLLSGLQWRMDVKEDDIRCYRLVQQLRVDTLGRQLFPEGVQLFSQGGVNLIIQ